MAIDYHVGKAVTTAAAVDNLEGTLPEGKMRKARSLEFACQIVRGNIDVIGEYNADTALALDSAWTKYAEVYAQKPREERPLQPKELIQAQNVTYFARCELVDKPAPKTAETGASPRQSGAAPGSHGRHKVTRLF